MAGPIRYKERQRPMSILSLVAKRLVRFMENRKDRFEFEILGALSGGDRLSGFDIRNLTNLGVGTIYPNLLTLEENQRVRCHKVWDSEIELHRYFYEITGIGQLRLKELRCQRLKKGRANEKQDSGLRKAAA